MFIFYIVPQLYHSIICVFLAPLLLNTIGERPQTEDYQTAQLLGIVLDILSFCVEHHTYHIKNFIIQKDLLKRILVLMKSSHTFLVLGALRLLRKIVALKDEFYNRYVFNFAKNISIVNKKIIAVIKLH